MLRNFVAASCLVTFFTITSYAQEQFVQPLSELGRWEYKVQIFSGPMTEAQLNVLGNQGWELVSAFARADQAVVNTFKRPKQSNIAQQEKNAQTEVIRLNNQIQSIYAEAQKEWTDLENSDKSIREIVAGKVALERQVMKDTKPLAIEMDRLNGQLEQKVNVGRYKK